ncbi:MAG: choice-of-anchor D domain-containing protein [Candidatus Acidiferrales bacterium]
MEGSPAQRWQSLLDSGSDVQVRANLLTPGGRIVLAVSFAHLSDFCTLEQGSLSTARPHNRVMSRRDCVGEATTGTSRRRCSQRTAAAGTSSLSIATVLLAIVLQVGCAAITSGPGTSISTGSATISLTPPSINYPSVVVGNTDSQAVIVTNTGTENLTVTQAALIGAQFSVSGISLPLTLSAGHQTTFTVSFSPTSAGSASGSLSITSSASSTPTTIALSGTGVAATQLLGASPTSLSFGNVNDGSSSTLSVTLTNNGNANVTIASVAPVGAGFSTNGLSAGTALTPNQSATLNIVFAPTGTGSVSGSVSITSNATNSPASISLSGAGVRSTSHSVDLSWTASASSGVVGYNVYRGTSSGSYSRIASLVSGTTYTDSTVQSGQDITYYYVVTSLNSSGVESADSNQASVTIP